MSTIRKSTRAVVAGATLVLSVALTACGGTTAPGTTPATGAATASAPAGTGAQHNDADVAFAQMMIPHHQQAIEMADMAADRAQSADVKALAHQIKAAQDPEIATLNGFLTNWGAAPAQGGMDHSGMDHSTSTGMMTQTDMDALSGAVGASFDKMFLEMMVKHHEGAVAASQREVSDGANPQAKDLASKIISAQNAEIGRMKQLLG